MGIGRFGLHPDAADDDTGGAHPGRGDASPIDRRVAGIAAAWVASLAAMPLLPNTIGYQASRLDQIPALRSPMYALSS
jgi:hypothetical protein